ncbi:MAG: Unknown protein [uncultured Sulfurovum sp.]|uniref:Uncharacterized protein n=1 Tax=uncultured Sulfurovum sp. TaxID=269237 RepID=A0A6S6SCB7_9BACT|nr:MAG: Unknown protein [uncultured Sulfurovum sp.]
MLTLYSEGSSFKKKVTVVVIWLVALALSFLLLELIRYEGSSLLMKAFPSLIGLFMIAGILLRCKFARAFTLITIYIIALFPIVANFLVDGSILLFSMDTEALFTTTEILMTNIIWALLFIVPIYFLSNNKSMDIFFIESNPIEHLFFVAVAIGLIFAYTNYYTLALL